MEQVAKAAHWFSTLGAQLDKALKNLMLFRPGPASGRSLDQLMSRGPFQPWLFSDSVVLRGGKARQQKDKEVFFNLALLLLFLINSSVYRVWSLCFYFSRQMKSRWKKRISQSRRSGLKCYRSMFLQREATFLGGSEEESGRVSLVYIYTQLNTEKNMLESNTVMSWWTIVKGQIIINFTFFIALKSTMGNSPALVGTDKLTK